MIQAWFNPIQSDFNSAEINLTTKLVVFNSTSGIQSVLSNNITHSKTQVIM